MPEANQLKEQENYKRFKRCIKDPQKCNKKTHFKKSPESKGSKSNDSQAKDIPNAIA